MKRNTDRIRTTHAGSLPRPDDLTRLMWDLIRRQTRAPALAKRVTEAVSTTLFVGNAPLV